MHKVQVADARVDEGLERREPDALEDARPEEGAVVVAARAAPDAGDDDEGRAEEVEVSFPPDAGGGDEEEARDADAEEVVSG